MIAFAFIVLLHAAYGAAPSRLLHTSQQFLPQQANCRCGRIYLPVCGADGRFYSNACLARCAGTTVASTAFGGAASCSFGNDVGDEPTVYPGSASFPSGGRPYPMPRNAPGAGPRIAPVGGPLNNGAGFNQPTSSTSSGSPINTQRTSSQPTTSSGNPINTQPPSSTNGGSGGNRRLLAAVAQRLPGSKTGVCACPDNYKPVCGSDKKRYANQCLAECAGVTVIDGAPGSSFCGYLAIDPVGPPNQPSQPIVPPTTGNSNSGAVTTGSSNSIGNGGGIGGGSSIGGGIGSTGLPGHHNSGRHGSSKPQGGRYACACPLILAPVCGVNNKVYANACMARCEGVATTERRPDANNSC